MTLLLQLHLGLLGLRCQLHHTWRFSLQLMQACVAGRKGGSIWKGVPGLRPFQDVAFLLLLALQEASQARRSAFLHAAHATLIGQLTDWPDWSDVSTHYALAVGLLVALSEKVSGMHCGVAGGDYDRLPQPFLGGTPGMFGGGLGGSSFGGSGPPPSFFLGGSGAGRATRAAGNFRLA